LLRFVSVCFMKDTDVAKEKMTIYDVAKETGCSPATVSRALNHPDLVRPDTLEAIRRVMNSGDFRKRKYRLTEAESLKAPTGCFLLSIPSPGNPFYGQIIEGAASAAAAHGCTLLTDYSMYAEHAAAGISLPAGLSRFDGMILMTGLESRPLLRLAEHFPVIQCSEYNEEIDTVSSVSIDDAASMRKAADHLIASGHRKLAYISCPAQMRYAGRRLRGFRAACEAADLEVPDSRIIILPQTGFAVAHSAALRLLSASPRPDAVVCSSDIYAIACVKAAYELGIQIPGDLSVIGFDDIPQASMIQLALTTIRQPRYQLGYTAFETLWQEVQDPARRKQKVLLPTELIIRETTGMRQPSEHSI